MIREDRPSVPLQEMLSLYEERLQRRSTGKIFSVDEELVPRTIETLDDAENKWFPIAKVALERHFPAVAEKFFLNLGQRHQVWVTANDSSSALRGPEFLPRRYFMNPRG